ncbi:MAG: hypothetical protein K2P93_07935 [Alphaproteobacteria bacterium]|nr:hypothetical protein [Alphaproteobacteria bacterium]
MKYYKSFLLASVFSSIMIPATLSAVTADELADKIRNTRACPVVITDQAPPVQGGWFSSFRQKTGNALRWFGDKLRTEEDSQIAADHVKQMAKDVAVAALSYETGFSFSRNILNPIGNAFRKVGQWIKGGEETQTTTRTVLNNLGLNKSSKDADVENALRLSAQATLKADAATAFESYGSVVVGLDKRGFSTKHLDSKEIYMDTLAGQILRNRSNSTYEAFSQEMHFQGMPILLQMKGIKNASDGEKVNLMNIYLKEAFNRENAKIKFDETRASAAAAA